MARDAEALGEIGGRERAVGIAGQFEHGVEAEPRRRLQLHDKSLSSCKDGPATMPWARKKLRIRWSLRSTRVRTRVTPSTLKRSTSASNSAVPTPFRRSFGSI